MNLQFELDKICIRIMELRKKKRLSPKGVMIMKYTDRVLHNEIDSTNRIEPYEDVINRAMDRYGVDRIRACCAIKCIYEMIYRSSKNYSDMY